MRFKLVCIVAGMLLALLAGGGGEGRASGGPLTSDGFGRAGAERHVGEVVTAFFAVTNRSRTPATIERVRLRRADPALRVLGVRTSSPTKKWGGGGFVDGFPPRGYPQAPPRGLGIDGLRNAVGSSIPHGSTLVLVGLTATRPGFHAARDVVVDYHVGVQRFEAVYWLDVYFCTRGTCPF